MASAAEVVEEAPRADAAEPALNPAELEQNLRALASHTGLGLSDLEKKLMLQIEMQKCERKLSASETALAVECPHVTDNCVRQPASQCHQLLRGIFHVRESLRIFPSLSSEQMTDVMATLDALIRATKLMYSGCVAVDTGYTKEVAAEYVHNLFSKAITLDLDPKYEHFQWLCVDSKMADKLKAKHPAPASAPRLAVATAPQPPPGWQPQYLPQYQYPPQYLPQPAAQYNQPPQYGQALQEPHQQRGPNPKRNRVRSARRHAQHYACLELL